MSSVLKVMNQNTKISLNQDVAEIDIDLRTPRVITIKGTDKKGKEITWHLKVTEKGRLVLV
jgi:hypothetical protein